MADSMVLIGGQKEGRVVPYGSVWREPTRTGVDQYALTSWFTHGKFCWSLALLTSAARPDHEHVIRVLRTLTDAQRAECLKMLKEEALDG